MSPPASGDGRHPRWKVALVTGASSGIGEAFAEQLAAEGSNLIVVARRRDRLAALSERLEAAHGVEVEVMVADLTDAAELAQVEARLRDPARPVELLVNNAGFGTQGLFIDLPLARQADEIRLNVLAATCLAHAAVSGMVARGYGGIVNVSSVASLLPLPYWAVYSATKAFLTSFSVALHEEVRGAGVKVVALLPGLTRTEFHDRPHITKSPVPGPAWISAGAVAAAGLRAVAKGQARAYPGMRARLVGAVCQLAPGVITRRAVAAVGRRL